MTLCDRQRGWRGVGLMLALFVISSRAEQVADQAARPLTQIEAGMMADVTDLMKAEAFSDAEAKLRDILKRNPDLVPARQMLAAVMISLNQYSNAIDVLENMLVDMPSDHRVLNNLSWLLSTASDHQYRNPPRALQLAQDAVLVAPGDFHVWSTLAEAHHVNANFDQAVNAMRQAVDIAARVNAPVEVRQKYNQQLQTLMETAAIMSLMEQ